MKKIICLVIAAVASMSLTACSQLVRLVDYNYNQEQIQQKQIIDNKEGYIKVYNDLTVYSSKQI